MGLSCGIHMRTRRSSYVLYNLKNARLFIEGDECDTKGGIQRKESDFQYEKTRKHFTWPWNCSPVQIQLSKSNIYYLTFFYSFSSGFYHEELRYWTTELVTPKTRHLANVQLCPICESQNWESFWPQYGAQSVLLPIWSSWLQITKSPGYILHLCRIHISQLL